MITCVVVAVFAGCTIDVNIHITKGVEEKEKVQPGLKAGQKPFSELVKDHEKLTGLFTVYKGKDTLYFEIPFSAIGRPYGLHAALVGGLGDWGTRGSAIGTAVIEFQRHGDWISVVKKDLRFRADRGTPEWHALKDSFPDSPILQTFIESKNPQTGLPLVNLREVFLTGFDVFRLPSGYKLQKDSVAIDWIRNHPENMMLKLIYHFKREDHKTRIDDMHHMCRLDKDELQIAVQYNLFKLPDPPMRPRFTDERLSLFEHPFKDYTGIDRRDTPFRHYAMRFRIEKADPAPISVARKPVTFWIEKGVPDRYRAWIKEAVLWWNKAFEKIGIKGAIQVRDQPADAVWTGSDIRYNMIFWNFSDELLFSGMAGPMLIDPRTAEILQSHVYLNAEFPSYAMHRYLAYTWWRRPPVEAPGVPPIRCDRIRSYSSQLAFARLVLKGRGLLTQSEKERFLEQAFKELVAHEVGHALGLGHNFKASILRSAEDILGGKVGRGQIFSGSIMDYNPVNLPPRGKKPTDYLPTSIGPYDELAIRYLYAPIDAKDPQDEIPILNDIAKRAEREKGLVCDGWLLVDVDPYTNTDDYGDDPLKFAEARFEMVREILDDLAGLVLKEGQDYHQLRCAMDACIFSILADYIYIVAKHIGGQHIYKDRLAGGLRPAPIQPVEPARQRKALQILDRYIFSGDYFIFPAELRNRLNPPFLTDWNLSKGQREVVYCVDERMGWLLKFTLDLLLDPRRVARVQDNERRTVRDLFTLPEYLGSLTDRIYKELEGQARAISHHRRTLQRLYVDRLGDLVLRKPGGQDIKGVATAELKKLKERIQRVVNNKERFSRLDGYTRAHLQYILAQIQRVLGAQIQLAPQRG